MFRGAFYSVSVPFVRRLFKGNSVFSRGGGSGRIWFSGICRGRRPARFFAAGCVIESGRKSAEKHKKASNHSDLKPFMLGEIITSQQQPLSFHQTARQIAMLSRSSSVIRDKSSSDKFSSQASLFAWLTSAISKKFLTSRPFAKFVLLVKYRLSKNFFA